MRKNLIPLGGLALAIALVLSANAKASAGDSNLGDITDKSPPGETSLLALGSVDKTAPVALTKEVVISEAVAKSATAFEKTEAAFLATDIVVGASFATNNLSPRRMSAGDLSELGSVLRL